MFHLKAEDYTAYLKENYYQCSLCKRVNPVKCMIGEYISDNVYTKVHDGNAYWLCAKCWMDCNCHESDVMSGKVSASEFIANACKERAEHYTTMNIMETSGYGMHITKPPQNWNLPEQPSYSSVCLTHPILQDYLWKALLRGDFPFPPYTKFRTVAAIKTSNSGLSILVHVDAHYEKMSQNNLMGIHNITHNQRNIFKGVSDEAIDITKEMGDSRLDGKIIRKIFHQEHGVYDIMPFGYEYPSVVHNSNIRCQQYGVPVKELLGHPEMMSKFKEYWDKPVDIQGFIIVIADTESGVSVIRLVPPKVDTDKSDKSDDSVSPSMHIDPFDIIL